MHYFNWLERTTADYPRTYELLDESLSQYAEALWQDGESRNYLSDVLSAMGFHYPMSKGRLRDAWKQNETWNRLELPARATPFTLRILRAACGCAIVQGKWNVAAGLWLGFQGLLRTGELTRLCMNDIEIYSDKQKGIVRLGYTKSGKRRGET